MTAKKRYKYTAVRQWGGDDGYCWAVFRKGETHPVICGLTRPEVPYYRDRLELCCSERARGCNCTPHEGPPFGRTHDVTCPLGR